MHLALDLSKRSTGWALWSEGWPAPRAGHFSLGSEFTTNGEVFVNLHRRLDELRKVAGGLETVTYEEPLLLGPSAGNTSAETQLLLIGLEAHVHSYCAARGILRVQYVNQSTWRKHFIGSMRRGTKRATIKELTMERCREVGWAVQRDDEADALGILDYYLHLIKAEMPWRDRAVFGPVAS